MTFSGVLKAGGGGGGGKAPLSLQKVLEITDGQAVL